MAARRCRCFSLTSFRFAEEPRCDGKDLDARRIAGASKQRRQIKAHVLRWSPTGRGPNNETARAFSRIGMAVLHFESNLKSFFGQEHWNLHALGKAPISGLITIHFLVEEDIQRPFHHVT